MDNNTALHNCLLSNFCNLIPIQLDNSNYVTWKFLLETLLRGCGLMKYVDGSFPCPPQLMIREDDGIISDMTKEYLNWEQNDSAVMSILAATLSSDVLSFVVGSKTSRELWCLLKERYASTSRYNIIHLKTNFQKIRKGADSIDKYLLRVKIACDQLANVGVHMSDDDIIFSVLHGLPSEYATMKAIIRIKQSPVSMQEVRSLLLIAEDEIEQTAKSISLPYNCHVPAGVTNPNAYIASASSPITEVGYVPPSAKMTPSAGYQSASNSNALMKNGNYMPNVGRGNGFQGGYIGGNGGFARNNGGNDNGNTITCQLCRKIGHGAKTCRTLSTFQQGNNLNNAHSGCQYCGQFNHTAARCYDLIGFPNQHNSIGDASPMVAAGYKGSIQVKKVPSLQSQSQLNTVPTCFPITQSSPQSVLVPAPVLPHSIASLPPSVTLSSTSAHNLESSSSVYSSHVDGLTHVTNDHPMITSDKRALHIPAWKQNMQEYTQTLVPLPPNKKKKSGVILFKDSGKPISTYDTTHFRCLLTRAFNYNPNIVISSPA